MSQLLFKVMSITKNNLFIEVVLPVLNEEQILEKSVRTVDQFLAKKLPYRYQITIADNGSTDQTYQLAQSLARQLKTVQVVKLPLPGRGKALRQVWLKSSADIVSYMDIDLSVNLNDFLLMLKSLIRQEADIAVASRLHPQAKTQRSLKRSLISRSYNFLAKLFLKTKLSDLQCGCKALRREVAQKLLPQVKDNKWFFDTELLVRAEKAGFKIHEQPVTFVDRRDSRVKITQTALDDIKGLYRLRREFDQRSFLEKSTLPILLFLATTTYTLGAIKNGLANEYYSSAVQSASQNWRAWFFGSFDSANYISIDKTPLASMLMGLSTRFFGFSPLAMMLPSILAGVGTVWLLFNLVKRYFGFKEALLTAVLFLITPVTALVFSYNNPDSLLTFFLVASAFTFWRALETSSLSWLVVTAVLTGLAFNLKMAQGLVLLPLFVSFFWFFFKQSFRFKIKQFFIVGITTLVVALGWSAIVALTPINKRPWVGGTTDNSIWSLIFGYNGLDRFSGGQQATSSSITKGFQKFEGQPGFGGQRGLWRIFNLDFGPNIGWFLPLAYLGGMVMLFVKGLKKSQRRLLLFWLAWLALHQVIFSYVQGIIHPYYVVVMAPATALLIGVSLVTFWQKYSYRRLGAILLLVAMAITLIPTFHLLNLPEAMTWLKTSLIFLGFFSLVVLIIYLTTSRKVLFTVGATSSFIAILISPLSYTLVTTQVAHHGSILSAGPTPSPVNNIDYTLFINDSLLQYLLHNQGQATWLVAVANTAEASSIQLATKQPVMAIGGFSGTDTPLTLDQFKDLVAQGKLKYYASFSFGGMPQANQAIWQWIQSHSQKVDYGGAHVTLYRLIN